MAKEIALVTASHTSKTLVHTLYFGGGTPSLLSIDDLRLLVAAIHQNFEVAALAEITLEANPDDITPEKLAAWKAIGINRLSIGVQSFFEADLQWMNRLHNAVQARENLLLAGTYFDNITADLIYGIPGLTDDRWKHNVDTMLGCGVQHVSCYALTVEPKTPLQKWIRLQKKEAVNTEQQAAQFLKLMDWMQQAGYEHYEISNFAKPGHRSVHNTSYWQGKPYIGIGPAAHSYDGVRQRQWNVANNQKYIDAIHNHIIPCEQETLTPTQQHNEYIMTALRTIEGINLTTLPLQSEVPGILKAAKKYEEEQLLQINNHRVQLTKEGKLFADGIAADLFKA